MQLIKISPLHPHFIIMTTDIVQEQHVTRGHIADGFLCNFTTNIRNECDWSAQQPTQQIRMGIHVGEIDFTRTALVCKNDHP